MQDNRVTEHAKIKIILVDDHPRVHQVMGEMFDFFDDIDLIARGSNGQEAIDLCNLYQADLVLMDMVMPVMNGVEATRRILEKYPETKILALSSFEDPNAVQRMLEQGAVGYILKTSSGKTLYNTIRAAIDGQAVLSPEIVNVMFDASKDELDASLTPREREVLTLFASGMTYNAIATKLSISASTVKFHVNNITAKLGVDTREEALVIAAKNNLI